MGCYINPTVRSKEEFLFTFGKLIDPKDAIDVYHEEGYLPVCLVNNGTFTAAAVGYDKREIQCFLDAHKNGDNRPQTWFKVSIQHLSTVSDVFKHIDS